MSVCRHLKDILSQQRHQHLQVYVCEATVSLLIEILLPFSDHSDTPELFFS